jgi:hypothetical protein
MRKSLPRVASLGIRDYVKTVAPEPEVLRLIGEASVRNGTDRITVREIDEEIKAVRAARRLRTGKR